MYLNSEIFLQFANPLMDLLVTIKKNNDKKPTTGYYNNNIFVPDNLSVFQIK